MRIAKQFFFDPANLIWLFIFCAVPFIQSELTVDPDYVPKMIAFAIILLAGSLYFIFSKNTFVVFQRSTSVFYILLGGYILTVLLSLFKSVNTGDSLFDAIKILLPLLLLPVFIFVIKRNENSLLWILKLQNVAVFIFTFYGAQQFLNLWKQAQIDQLPFEVNFTIASTLGNKNFFAETMLLLLPFSFAGIFMLKSIWKWISCLSGLIIIAEIILLKTISVQVAFVAGLFFALFIFIFFNQKIKKVFASTKNKLLALFVLVVIALAVSQTSFFKSSLEKINSVKSSFSKDANVQIDYNDTVNANSTYTRWFLWKNSYQLFCEHPLSGIGIGNWKLFYPKYGVSGAYYLNAGSNRFEHPHNEYFLMLAERGIFSVLLWLAILFAIIFYALWLIKKIKERKEKLLIACMATGIIFFLIISFFGYPLYRSYSPMLLSLIMAIIISKYVSIVKNQEQNRAVARIIFLLLICFSTFSIYVLSKRYESEVLMNKAFKEQSLSHFDRMNKLVCEADNFFFPVDLTSTPLNWYKGFSFFYIQQVDSALYYFLEAEKQNPYHLQVLSDIGACYENRGEHEKAIAYFDRALAITPLYKETFINKVVAIFNTGRTEEAFRLIHLQKYDYVDFYQTCRKTILIASIKKTMEREPNPEKIKFIASKLSDDEWLRILDLKTDTSFAKLQNLLEDEFKKK